MIKLQKVKAIPKKKKNPPKKGKSTEREMMHYLEGKIIQITVSFLSETMEYRSKWHTIFQVLKEKNC